MKPAMHLARGLLILASVMCPLLAQSQTMKPGLWELSSSMKSGSGEMEKAMAQLQQQMASMSPEQRKMMQDAMGKHGVSMGSGGPGAMQLKVCLTKEMLDRNEFVTQEGDCKTQNAPRVGNTMKVSFTCTRPPSSGEGEVTFISPESYRSTMAVNSTARGKAERLDMESQGKWLTADCGSVKPIGSARK